MALDGLDREAAEQHLLASLPDPTAGELTLVLGDHSRSLSYAQLGRRHELGPVLDEAFALGRRGGPLERAREHLRALWGGQSYPVSVTYEAAAVDRAVMEMVAAVEQPLIDARVRYRAGRYVAHSSTAGVEVDEASLSSAAHSALAGLGTTTGPTHVVAEPLVTEPARLTAAAEAAADRANTILATAITLVDGSATQTIPVEEMREWLELTPEAGGDYRIELSATSVEADLATLAETVAISPVAAGLAFADDGSVVAVAGSEGRALDPAVTAERIVAALEARGEGASDAPVELAISPVAPRYTTAQAEAAAPQVVRVSNWTTAYTVNERNFNGNNITIPTSRIHGQAVAPGRQFDFWRAIGGVSTEDGYGPGGAIVNGRTEPTGALAGGICSCSTTIFNAALRAGLEMGARRNHYYYIDRYPLGLDATVFRSSSGSVQSMRFRNDTEHPVLIKGINSHGKVRFEIWTVPTGRTVTFSEPRVEDRRTASDTLEYTDDLAPGVRSRTEYPTEGFRSWITRTVRDASGAIVHRDTFYSNYAAIDGITLVGRSPGDPPDGTIVVVG